MEEAQGGEPIVVSVGHPAQPRNGKKMEGKSRTHVHGGTWELYSLEQSTLDIFVFNESL